MNKTTKLITILFVAVISVTLTNCTSAGLASPGLRTNGLDLAKADYTIGNNTVGKACKTRLFGVIWSDLMESNQGYLPGYWFNHVASAAVYDALNKIPDATYVVEPRFEVTSTGLFPLFGEQCVTVRARAVTLGNGPAK